VGLLSQFQLFRPPALALAAETLKLERTLSDLADQAYALTPVEIELMWKTTPSRMPIAGPLGMREVPISPAEFVR
jgi:hypothetical protein